VGGPSGNVITGLAGADVFIYQRAATDTEITDFGSTYFTATLAGAQENPPNASSGAGAFIGALNRARTEFAFQVTVTGVDLSGNQTPATPDNVTLAHFHAAVPGVNGGVVWGFIGTPNNDTDNSTTVNPTTGLVTGEWHLGQGNATTLTAQIPSLLASGLYINFHTVALPGGEIRGQVIPVDTGGDKIDLRDAHIGDFESLGFVMRNTGNSTLISILTDGRAGNLMLDGVTTASLTANDFIFADATPTNMAGYIGADEMFGAGGADTLSGIDGADRLFGAGGADLLDGGAGADTLYGQGDADTVRGGEGGDSIQGNAGADSLSGGDGNDQIFAGKDNDSVYGDAGADTLSGDTGDDNLFGGAGADRFVFRAGTGRDWAIDFNFAEGDRVMLSPGTTYTTGAFQNQVVLTLSSGDVIGLVGITPTSFTADYVVFG
jgi:Ca2+-binding RTX toxin-like protein